MSDLLPNTPIPSELPETPALPTSQAPSLLQTWLRALTRPSEQTYSAIAASPRANLGMALLWVFLAALLEMIVYFLVLGPVQNEMEQALSGSHSVLPFGGLSLLTVACGAPIAAGGMLVGFLFSSGLTHVIARAFSGKATYGQWAYTMSAMFAPTALISSVLLALEALGTTVALCMGVLSLVFSLYVIVLEVIAIRAVHQISWGGAVVSIIAIPTLLLFIACAVIAVLMLLGPAIGNTFSAINQSLNTVP